MIIYLPARQPKLVRAYRKAERELGCHKVARMPYEGDARRYFIRDNACDEVFDFVMRACGQPTYQESVAQLKNSQCVESAKPPTTNEPTRTAAHGNISVSRLALCLSLWRLLELRRATESESI